jgi:nitrate reductase NapAB chaperone NapD
VPGLRISFDSSELELLVVLDSQRVEKLGNDLPALGPLDAVLCDAELVLLDRLVERYLIRVTC